MNFVLGIKTEMTQIFTEDGKVVPVTIINVGGNVVAEVRNIEKNGYNAMVIGMGVKKNPNMAEVGKYKYLGFVPRYLAEVRVDSVEGVVVGEKIDIEKFAKGGKLNITGRSKGKGFQGVVKRYNFAGGPKTHGQSDRLRAPGSIGAGTTPGRVLKGKKMPGRMGFEKVTVSNLELVEIDGKNGIIVVKGAVPGVKGGFLKIIQK